MAKYFAWFNFRMQWLVRKYSNNEKLSIYGMQNDKQTNTGVIIHKATYVLTHTVYSTALFL